MRAWAKVLGAAAVLSALVLGWGYWYSVRHVSLQLSVDDYALKSPTQRYGAPHGVTLTLRDRQNAQVAIARSVEPGGYLLAVHPDPRIGNCQQASQSAYADCYAAYSAWSATWAERVHSADVAVGACEVRGVPVDVENSNSEWALWWVPLPHIGGLPRRYFRFSVAVDTRACTAVSRAER